MSEMSNKKSLNKDVKEDGTVSGGSSTGSVPWVSSVGSVVILRHSNKDNKMSILCCFQAKEGPNIGYRQRMHQYWKDYGLFQLEEQHLGYQVRNILRTDKLSKVRIEDLKMQIMQLHVDSVEIET